MEEKIGHRIVLIFLIVFINTIYGIKEPLGEIAGSIIPNTLKNPSKLRLEYCAKLGEIRGHIEPLTEYANCYKYQECEYNANSQLEWSIKRCSSVDPFENPQKKFDMVTRTCVEKDAVCYTGCRLGEKKATSDCQSYKICQQYNSTVDFTVWSAEIKCPNNGYFNEETSLCRATIGEVSCAECEIGSRKGILNRCDAFEQCKKDFDGSSWIRKRCWNQQTGEPPKYFDMRTYTCLDIPLKDAVCYTGQTTTTVSPSTLSTTVLSETTESIITSNTTSSSIEGPIIKNECEKIGDRIGIKNDCVQYKECNNVKGDLKWSTRTCLVNNILMKFDMISKTCVASNEVCYTGCKFGEKKATNDCQSYKVCQQLNSTLDMPVWSAEVKCPNNGYFDEQSLSCKATEGDVRCAICEVGAKRPFIGDCSFYDECMMLNRASHWVYKRCFDKQTDAIKLYFDPKLNYCASDYEGVCINMTTTYRPTEISSHVTTTDVGCLSGEKIAHKTDCKRYWKCIDGKFRGFKCMRKFFKYQFYFDIDSRTCKEEAKCFEGTAQSKSGPHKYL